MRITESIYKQNPKQCKHCKQNIIWPRRANIYCSRKCSTIFNNKKRGPRSLDTKKKISIANSKPIFSSQQIKANANKIKARLGRNCINVNCKNTFDVLPSSTKKYCSLKCVYSDNKFRLDKSFLTKNTYINGKKVYGGTTKWYTVNTSNGVIRVQGTYEVAVCKILDNWKSSNKIYNWEYTTDRFEYIGLDNKKHLYLIDFKIYTSQLEFYYLEVKGFVKDIDKIKWNAVKNAGYNLVVWFKDDISKHGGMNP